ncbi:MAG: NosD domain-containing protein, partial [Candidatus Odinarchaeota archaeon]
MKSKNVIKTIFLIIFGVFLLTSAVGVNIFSTMRNYNDLGQKLNLSKIFGKIHIKNNWSDAKAAGICTGNGTSNDPYLIKDLEIDGGGVGSCIFIENSNDYFMILNCSLTNAEDDILFEEAGIKLYNSSNGQLINNTISNPDGVGIFLHISNDTTLIGNSINGNHEAGARIVICHNILAYLNNFRGQWYDVFFMDSTFRFFSERKITYIYEGRTYTSFMGNYWSSYPDEDNTGDGIGDEQLIYTDGIEYHIDDYPLIDPIENYQIIGFASGEAIPGYNYFLLIGILSVLSIFIINKINK